MPLIKWMRGIALGWLIAVLLFAAATAEEELVYSRIVDVPGIGTMTYYAQNDPRWAEMRYSLTSEGLPMRVKSAACGPTAMAMAIARQLPCEGLSALLEYAGSSQGAFQFCVCAVNPNRYRGAHEDFDAMRGNGLVDAENGRLHVLITPQTDEEFAAYLPVILANYAEGNNRRGHRFSNTIGTSIAMFEEVAEQYGLEYRSTREWSVARSALEEGYGVVTTVTKGAFTSKSHYLCVAGVADGYIYVLDPLLRTEYPLDKRGVLEVVEPGLVRAKEEDFNRLGFAGYYMVKRADGE